MRVDCVWSRRNPAIWGNGTNACASDSKHFGARDQNLTTQWHVRYGERGVMIYGHVERKSLCIYSQLKSPSSEVASKIEGVLHHFTEMEVDRHYVDSHGPSIVGFAFCRLLGFQRPPRLKAIGKQKLYRPDAGQPDACPNLQPVLTKPIDWELIRQQYDQPCRPYRRLAVPFKGVSVIRRIVGIGYARGMAIARGELIGSKRVSSANGSPA